MRLVATMALLLVTGSSAAQTPDAETALQELEAAFSEVRRCGRAASPLLLELCPEQRVINALSVMKWLARRLDHADSTPAMPQALVPKKACREFSTRLGAFIARAERGLGIVDASTFRRDALHTEFLARVRERLLAEVAYGDVRTFLQGVEPLEFKRTARLGEEAGAAVLTLFASRDFPGDVRAVAGEGVARLGSSEAIAAVRAVYQDEGERPGIRGKAKEISARLGDPQLVLEELKQTAAKIKEEKGRLAVLEAELKVLAEAVPSPGVAVDPRIETAEKREAIERRRRKRAETILRIGLLHAQMGLDCHHAQIHEKAEQHYRKALELWESVADLLERDRNHRQRVAITWYNLACIQSVGGRPEEGLSSLEQAFRWGYRNDIWIARDANLESVRALPGFQELMKKFQ